MLTRKQYDLLKLIHERTQRDGVSPSFDEMKEALDLRSKSGIHRLITALEERGFIRRLAHRARAVEVVKLPDNMLADGATSPRAAPERQAFSPRLVSSNDRMSAREPTTVPLVGRIAAGAPIEAMEHAVRSIAVPDDMLAATGEHYALEVRGDSMIEAGILDGDLVVIRGQDTANDGDIIVALIEDHEATLKTLRRRQGGRIALEAANPAYEARVLPADKVRIQGRLVGLVRRY